MLLSPALLTLICGPRLHFRRWPSRLRALYEQTDPAARARLAELDLDMATRALLLTR